MRKTYDYEYWKYFADGGWYISLDNSYSRGWRHLFDGIMEQQTPVSLVSFFKETGIKPSYAGQVVVAIHTVEHANRLCESVCNTEYCQHNQLWIHEGLLRSTGYTRSW